MVFFETSVKSEMKFKAGAIGDRRKTNRDHDKITAK